MINLLGVTRATNNNSIFRSSKDIVLLACFWRLATMMFFFGASAVGARPIPLETQMFTISAESVELALLQIVEQSGHQLIMQGTNLTPKNGYDYRGTATLQSLLSTVLFESGFEHEILANNIVVINAEKQFNGNVVAPPNIEKTIKSTFNRLEQIMLSTQQQVSDALDVSVSFRVQSAPAVDTAAQLSNEDIQSLNLNLSLSQRRGSAQSSSETAGMLAKVKGNTNMGPAESRGIEIIMPVTELTQSHDPIQNRLNFEASIELTSYFGIRRLAHLDSLSQWQSEPQALGTLPATVSRDIAVNLEVLIGEQALVDGGVSFVQASYPVFDN